ncbi:hypothetical protein BJX62DRAFT_234809 [Aspergillus germanicus]
MTEFTLFPLLPAEIRIQIWQMAIGPRTVEIREVRKRIAIDYFVSSTPVPAVLQVCHESRTHAPYRKAFALGNSPRYVWVDFEADMISIGGTHFLDLDGPDARLIRRLRFERENDEWFFHYEPKEMLDVLGVLEEVHVVCKDSPWAWCVEWEYLGWPCPTENLRFIDKETGGKITGEELERVWAEWEESGIKGTFGASV